MGCWAAALTTNYCGRKSTQQRNAEQQRRRRTALGIRGVFSHPPRPPFSLERASCFSAGTEAVSWSEPRLWTGTRTASPPPSLPLPCRPGVEDMTGSSCAAGRRVEHMATHKAPCLLLDRNLEVDWTGWTGLDRTRPYCNRDFLLFTLDEGPEALLQTGRGCQGCNVT